MQLQPDLVQSLKSGTQTMCGQFFLSALLFDDLHTEMLTAVGLLDLIEKRFQRIFDRKLN